MAAQLDRGRVLHTHTLTYHLQPTHSPSHSPKIISLDLSMPSSLPEKAHEALQAFGRVDILVNNAGISSRGSVMNTDLTVDRKVMETNFFGTIALTKGEYHHYIMYVSPLGEVLLCVLLPFLPSTALLPSMLDRGRGQIVVISSLQGKIGLPQRSSCKLAREGRLQVYSESSSFFLTLLQTLPQSMHCMATLTLFAVS